MKKLMEKLGVPIPEFTFERGIDLWLGKDGKVRGAGVTREATKFENFKKM